MPFDERNTEMLLHLNSLDPLPPRVGERAISFMEFIGCLEQRLQVNRKTKTELPISDDKPFIPYLVLPVTFELRDIKQFVCNVTVPFKHLMYVQNGPLYSTSEFLDATEAVFSFTTRLQIRRYPKNIGYAGALNVAMRHAMTFPFEEVPFFTTSNNDVRFPGDALVHALPKFLSASMSGAGLLKEFMAEVATEPNEYTPEVFRAVPLRSWDGEHVVVTSRYLPDRVRYMNADERKKIFRSHAGVLFPDWSVQAAFYALTRLAIETAGFFDENCYPAYWEDPDYMQRVRFLGLHDIRALGSKDGVFHPSFNFLDTEKAHAASKELGDVLVFLRGVTEILLYKLSEVYWNGKPATVNVHGKAPTGVLLPLDAYVLNERRRRALEEMIQLSLQHYRSNASARVDRTKSAKIIAFVNPEKREQLLNELNVSVDGVAYYKNGYTLRRLSLAM
ncbi:beta galactofuranosyl glycosyle transferase [Leptomonas pyrrhocoris]|uniref:Beta galactofuranosyl glycosyle transferase n=1 Tax=Leptomonas pyrrhocoris TaxID=157538 RepID=A0A0N0DWP9_LEPPY|nr:beta galactofuranosyl glycosyle transferase [Leptomonas pyrrhocoris]KPA82051.1 beta galactofuranosyl glycosyle transferase [Leptomonas pyrrhocoris]|eukprot:XP_015660490.1 beta galactofuranosyl glycosyle transferase [Leptomonas pyrrhocoris]